MNCAPYFAAIRPFVFLVFSSSVGGGVFLGQTRRIHVFMNTILFTGRSSVS